MPLRLGQHRAVDRIVRTANRLQSAGATTARVQYLAATGSGKTIVSRVLADMLGATSMAFGAPRIDLLGQAYQEYRRATNRAIEPIIVCSAPDIRDARGFPPGTPVTTNAEALRAHLLKPVPVGVLRVVFFTYQSSRRLVRAMTGLPMLDLLVLDEAHRVAREDSAFAVVWDATALPARVRLAQTATPRPEMSLAGVYGVLADRYTVGEGIADKVLCDYRVHVLGVDDQATATLLRAERDRRAVAVANALLTAIDEGRMRRVLTFHRRRADAQQFARISRLLATARGIRIPTLLAQSGLDSPSARAEALTRLETSGGIIASPRIYLEGIDVRGVDTVVFVDPKSSEIDISQAVGRAMRINPSDPAKVAQIVIPVAVSATEGATTLLEGSEFRRVWEVLRVLAAQDPRLREAFEAFRPRAARAHMALMDIEPNAAPVFTSEISDPTPRLQLVDVEVSDAGGHSYSTSSTDITSESGAFLATHFGMTGEMASFSEAVTFRAVEGIGDQRAKDIALLEAFAERAGTTRIAPTFVLPDEYPLGARIGRLRADYHSGRLPPEFLVALERIPGWVRDSGPRSVVAIIWPLLLTYEAEHGQAAVPLDAEMNLSDEDEKRAFGREVEAIREARRQNQLTSEEVLQCETLAGWTWDITATTLYMEALPLIRAFVAEYGTARIPAPMDWPGPRTERDVIAVASDLRLAYAAGTLPTGDERALEREFAFPWTRPAIKPSLRRRFAAAAARASAKDEFAAAWGTPVANRRKKRRH